MNGGKRRGLIREWSPRNERDRAAISRAMLSERYENGGRITIAAPSIPETEAGREVSSRATAASRTSAIRTRKLLVYIEPRGCSSLSLSLSLSLALFVAVLRFPPQGRCPPSSRVSLYVFHLGVVLRLYVFVNFSFVSSTTSWNPSLQT